MGADMKLHDVTLFCTFCHNEAENPMTDGSRVFCSEGCKNSFPREMNGSPVTSVVFDKGLADFRRETRASGYSPRRKR